MYPGVLRRRRLGATCCVHRQCNVRGAGRTTVCRKGGLPTTFVRESGVDVGNVKVFTDMCHVVCNLTLRHFSPFSAPTTPMQVVMKQYVDMRCAIYEFEREFWQGVVAKIVSHEKFNALPFSYIGEVQFLTDEYMEMRKESHLWYKILRQTYAYDLMNDLNKFYLPVKTRYKSGKTALKEV